MNNHEPLLSAYKKEVIEAGCDEAGRGCLAGPVVAAAVILPLDYSNDLLDDSKKLSKKVKDALRIDIEEKAIAYGVAEVSHKEIDQINILNASFLAMHRALEKLQTNIESNSVDGNLFKEYKKKGLLIPHQCIIYR